MLGCWRKSNLHPLRSSRRTLSTINYNHLTRQTNMPSRRRFKKIIKRNTGAAIDEILALSNFDAAENLSGYQQMVEEVVEKELLTVSQLSHAAVADSSAASPKEHFRSIVKEYDAWVINLSDQLDEKAESLVNSIRNQAE